MLDLLRKHTNDQKMIPYTQFMMSLNSLGNKNIFNIIFFVLAFIDIDEYINLKKITH